MERWQLDYCRQINQTTMSHTLQNCDLTGQRRHFNVSLRTQRFAFKVNEKKKILFLHVTKVLAHHLAFGFGVRWSLHEEKIPISIG